MRSSGAVGWTALAVRGGAVTATVVVAAVTGLFCGHVAVLIFGVLAVITVVPAVVQVRRSLLPCLVVSWLALQFLFATSHASLAARVAGTAGEVAGLWLIFSLFSLQEILPPGATMRRDLLSRSARRYATTVALSVTVAVVVVAAGALPARQSWIRVLGPLAAVVLLGVIAVALRQGREP